MKDKEFIHHLLSNSPAASQTYDSYRRDFLAYAYRYYQLTQSDAEEIFQESFIQLYKNLRDGKYEDQNKSLWSYLLGIGKFYILKHLEKKGRNNLVMQTLASEWIDDNIDNNDWKKSQEIARNLVYEAEETCNEILKLYYFERRKMVEIAAVMNYASEDVAKNKKSSCMRKFFSVLATRLKDNGIYWRNRK